MVDTHRLRDKIAEKRTNVSEVASKLGMDKATLYRRLSDSDAFTIGEVNRIVEILDLSHDEAVAIFFNRSVA